MKKSDEFVLGRCAALEAEGIEYGPALSQRPRPNRFGVSDVGEDDGKQRKTSERHVHRGGPHRLCSVAFTTLGKDRGDLGPAYQIFAGDSLEVHLT